jgi:hypothetical protein
MLTNHFAYLAAILAALFAAVPCRAEADLKLPREKVTLARRLSFIPMNRRPSLVQKLLNLR